MRMSDMKCICVYERIVANTNENVYAHAHTTLIHIATATAAAAHIILMWPISTNQSTFDSWSDETQYFYTFFSRLNYSKYLFTSSYCIHTNTFSVLLQLRLLLFFKYYCYHFVIILRKLYTYFFCCCRRLWKFGSDIVFIQEELGVFVRFKLVFCPQTLYATRKRERQRAEKAWNRTVWKIEF